MAVGLDLGAVALWLGVVVVLLGLGLSGLAYQGFRRNESQAMLLLAVGIFFITVVPTFFEEVVAFYIIRTKALPFVWVQILSRLSEAFGLGLLLYSVHTGRSR